MALTTIDDRGLKTPIDLLDNEKIRFGTGNDLEISHTGSYSLIFDSNNQSDLYIQTNERDITLKVSTTETAIVCNPNSAVELYFDNSKKFQTTSVGCGVTGNLTFADNGKAIFGAGDDLEIFHNGTNAEIKNITGQLLLDGQAQLNLRSAGNILAEVNDSETAFKAIADGAVELYHNNIKKLETTSTGASVTGHITLSGELNLVGGSDGERYIDVQTGDGSALNIRRMTGGDSSPEDMARFIGGQGVNLYYDNVKTFETSSNGIVVQGPEGGTGVIYLYADEGDDNADKWQFLANTDGTLLIRDLSDGSWDTNIMCVGGGAVELYYDNSKKFDTNSAGVKVHGICYFDDNNSARFGDGDDLKIYHSGSHSHVLQNGTGNLYLDAIGASVNLRSGDNAGGVHNSVVCNMNAGVELYHDNSKRAYTSTNGFQVYKTSSDDVEFRLVNDQNMVAGATNTILSQHDVRTTAKIVFGRMNNNSDFSAGAASTQGDIQFWTTQGGAISKKGTFINSGGLCFGTDTATANALDDYEIGTFTVADSSGQSLSFTNNTTAQYTKIGRFVDFHFDITFPTNSNTEYARITVPFQSGMANYGGGTVGWTDLGRPVQVHCNTSGCYLMDNDTSGDGKHLYNNSCTGKRFIGHITYKTTG